MGWSRRNFMVPLPRFASLEALNGYLEQRCRERQGDVLRGHRESIAKRLERDLEAMTALPGAPFDACHQGAGQVSSQSLVRYHNNDYSVPVAYGHRQVWVCGYVDRVVIGCAAEVIARHPRSYEGEDMVFDPLHYLPLIERKIGALDQAAPLAGGELRFEPIAVVADTHRECTAGNQTGHGWLQAEAIWNVAVAVNRKSVDIADERPSLYGVGRRNTGDPRRGVPIIYPDSGTGAVARARVARNRSSRPG